MRAAPLLSLLLIAACGPSASEPDATDDPPDETDDPPDTDPPIWTTPDAGVPRVMHRTFDSAAAGAEVSLHVFVPAPYDRDPDLRLPVVYYLHGTGAGTTGIRPLTQRFAQAMQRGDMPLALVVYPYGHHLSLWVDSHDGRVLMETVVVTEIVPFIDREYRTLATPEHRLVEGFSMGGYGAARYGFAYPDVFGSISILAGGPLQPDLSEGPRTTRAQRDALLDDVFGGDMAHFIELSPRVQAQRNADRLRDGRPIQLAIGTLDEILPYHRAFSDHLDEVGVDHDEIEVPDVAHEAPGLVDGIGEARWAFYWRAVGL